MRKAVVQTHDKREIVDITDLVEEEVKTSGVETGAVLVFVTHTTAAITAADLDPGTDQDYLNAFDKLLPQIRFNHPHNPEHMPDHILSSLIGTSLTVPFENGKLVLGTWQRIILLEFDGPRDRQVVIKILD
jgi:secondary thiamine-phosphate synthase enzyme